MIDHGPLLRHFAAQFDLPPGILSQPGTSLRIEPDREWTVLWPLGSHTLIRAPEHEAESLRALVEPGRLLSVDRIAAAWGSVVREDSHLYCFQPELFRPAQAPTGYHVRQLTELDRPAFEAFREAVPADALEEGDVDLSHEAAYGALHGDQIVSVASTYELLGTVDLGVITDPAAAGRGLGKATVTAAIRHHAEETRPIIYRMADTNHASRRLAEGLGLTQVLTMRGLRRF